MAAADPKVVSAGVDPLASPTPRPTERITAPVISGVNPDVVLSEGNLGDTHPSGSFVPIGISLPALMDPPTYVDLESQSDSQVIPPPNLSRKINNVNCGPASLAQALKILDPEGKGLAPTTNQLSDFLSARGLMYDWGTGVEELAFAAREFGYEGSIPFQNWSFKQLVDILSQGRPVVVSLGIYGADKPGHFVTLTGISEDGKGITYQDPVAGELILSREEFQSLWQLQGSAGMIPQKGSSAIPADPMLPWMGLFSAISALALTLNQSAGWRESRTLSVLRKQLANPLRKGIGGGPQPPKEPDVIRVPRYETKTVYRGIKTIEVEVPVYESRKVKVGIRGIKKKVPQYETRRVQVGVEQVTKRVPVYTTKRIQTGTRLVKKEIPVTRYKTKKEMIWKKYTKRVPVYRYIGSKRFVVGYKNETRWKRVPVTKKVPYQTTKTISIQVPVYKKTRVISGYKTVTETVPKFEQKQVLVGHKIIKETIPAFEERQVQVGTKIVTREVPQYETVRISIFDEPDPSCKKADGGDGKTPPPTGFSAEVWNSLSEEDQQKIRKDGISWAQEQEKINAAKENWIYKTYIQFRETKQKIADSLKNLGIPISSNESTNLVSISAYKGVNIDLLTENGVVTGSFSPPNILNLLYMEQTLSIQPKVVVTAFPGGPFDFNISSRKVTIRFGDVSLFGSLSGEFGFSQKIYPKRSGFDYKQIKQSFMISAAGITYKVKDEGIEIVSDKQNSQVDVKMVHTLDCKIITIKTIGLAIIAIGIVFSILAGYLIFTQGLLNPIIPLPIS